MKNKNIVLIGMSGAGKSTLGVLLAKALGKQFLDTDLLIQQKTGKLLQEILDREGVDRFLEIEEQALLSVSVQNCVIATGGSAVYSQKAMESLSQNALVVYLEVDFESLSRRLSNITTRGIVFKGSGNLRAVYEERLPLYQKYQTVTLNCSDTDIETAVKMLCETVSQF